ncbi:MAG: hypothetical protein HQK49_02155 [Oligoflexia bacterium]|nr:hypothetical protein [Oligoflexia bacterium]
MMNLFWNYFHFFKNYKNNIRLLLLIVLSILILFAFFHSFCQSSNAKEVKCNDVSILADKMRLSECAKIEMQKDLLSTSILTSTSESTLGSDANKYAEVTHQDLLEIALRSFPLSENRVKNMVAAAEVPDRHLNVFELLRHPWAHLYMYNQSGEWLWGGADRHFQDNLMGTNPEEIFGGGFGGLSAEYYYLLNDQENGDWYLGYALHFIADVTIIVHTSLPTFDHLDLLYKHSDFEKWIQNNFTSGHNFRKRIQNDVDSQMYNINNPAEDIREIAWQSSYWSGGIGYDVWNDYVESEYPLEAGSGNEKLVNDTTLMLKNALSYTRGAIYFMLNKYQQFDSKY